eukprot:TRINITY_DN45424_c0_g1_i1.p1 TRINITY_DN45424_c0_g1~~TRINITY_DN45424_c0_g1_i1.p1  ORF type:complete len:269 (-),score=42.50 TRINITY_DN45424_c0_g1_i1:119-838(-)
MAHPFCWVAAPWVLACVFLESITFVAEARSNEAEVAVTRGMEAFGKGSINASIELFDEAMSLSYPIARLWQRGLSLYYAGRFSDCSAQFRRDLTENSHDVEEAIWAMMCDSQLEGFIAARAKIPKVSREQRPVMRTAYSLFKGSKIDDVPRLDLTARARGEDADAFYSALYLGLFAEAQGTEAESKHWLMIALDTDYAKSSGDYMVVVARVHALVRGWIDGAPRDGSETADIVPAREEL